MLRYRLAFGSNTLTSKKACWSLTQNPLDSILNLASLLVLPVWLSNVSPVTDRSCGSISTSSHTSVSRHAVKSRRSLCLIVMNPAFLQLIACSMSILDQHAHFFYVFSKQFQNSNGRVSFSWIFIYWWRRCSETWNLVFWLKYWRSCWCWTNRWSWVCQWSRSSAKETKVFQPWWCFVLRKLWYFTGAGTFSVPLH